jgi:hypothetical protein
VTHDPQTDETDLHDGSPLDWPLNPLALPHLATGGGGGSSDPRGAGRLKFGGSVIVVTAAP